MPEQGKTNDRSKDSGVNVRTCGMSVLRYSATTKRLVADGNQTLR